MLNNVNAYLVFSSEQKSNKSECCSLVSEKTIEEHPEGFETQHCVFSLLKEYNKYDLSNAKTAFLTLGCIDDNKCLCCVDIDYKHDINSEDLRLQKKQLFKELRKHAFYIEVTKNGLHVFFFMPVSCHFGDNEHPIKVNDIFIKDIEFMGFNECKKDGSPKVHGRKILVWPTITKEGSRYLPVTHKSLSDGLLDLTSKSITYTPAQIIDLITKCCKTVRIEVETVSKKEYVEKNSDESALRKYNKKPTFKTTTFADCLEAIENSVIGNRDNTLFIVLQKMVDGDVDDIPSTWREDIEKSCAKINFLSGGRAKLNEQRFSDIDKNIGLQKHVIKDIFGYDLRPEYEEMILKSHDPSKEEKINVLKLRMLSALKNATIDDISEGKIKLYGKEYTFNDFEDELELRTSARINLKEIQSHLSKIQNAADERSDQKLRDAVDRFLAEGEERLNQCKENGEDITGRLKEFCLAANFPAVYMEMITLWLCQIFDRCLYPDHKTKWCLVQISGKQSIAKSSFVEALSKAFGFNAKTIRSEIACSSNENFVRELAKNRAYKPFLFFDEFNTSSKTDADLYKQLAEAGTVSYRNLYCSNTIEKQALALLVFNTNSLSPIPSSDTMATRYLILDYDRTQTNFKAVFQTLQERRGLKPVQDNNDIIAHELLVDVAAYYIKNLRGNNFSPENFKYIVDYQRKCNSSYRYHTEEEEFLGSQITRLFKALENYDFVDQKLNKKVLIALIKGDFDTYCDKTSDIASILKDKFRDTYFGVPQKYNIAKLSMKIRDIAQTITEHKRPENLGKTVWTKTGADRNPISLRELYDFFEAFDSMQDLEPLESEDNKETAEQLETPENTHSEANIETITEMNDTQESIEDNVISLPVKEKQKHYQDDYDEECSMTVENNAESEMIESEKKQAIQYNNLDDDAYRSECAKWKEKFARELNLQESERYWWRQMEDSPF